MNDTRTPSSPTSGGEPGQFAAWREARRHDPVAWVESSRHGSYWSVTSHEHARQVLEDAGRFVSSQGMRLGSHADSVGAAANKMLVVADGADHARVRAALAPWFSARAVSSSGRALKRDLGDLLDSVVTGEPVDVVEALADAVPTFVMGEMLDIDATDADELSLLVRAAFDEPDEDEDPTARRRRMAASVQVFSYFSRLVQARRDDPGDDIVTALVRSQGPGLPLPLDEVLLNCDGLVNGGLGTSRHAISGAVHAFADHPDQWARLSEDPSLVRLAVEEVLRWASPPMHMMRTATADTILGGRDVAAGDQVVLWIPSCNRDESVFADPDYFRIDRRPNRHLSLGAGPHYCIGASLGRMEIRVLLTLLLERVGTMEVVEPPRRTDSTFLNGLDRLQVVLTPLSR